LVRLDIAGTAMGSPARAINQSWVLSFGNLLRDHFAAKFYEHRSEPNWQKFP
jgi:hypothetical protein